MRRAPLLACGSLCMVVSFMKLVWLVRLAFCASLLLGLALVEPPLGQPNSGARVAPTEFVVRVFARAEGKDARRPLPHASVNLQVLDGELYRAGALDEEPEPLETDARGEWRGSCVRGPAWLIVRAPGFAKLALPLAASDARAEIEVELDRARELNVDVRVDDDAGELVALEGATVLVGEAGELPEAGSTDASGRAAFDELASGPVRVQVYARGYEPFIATTEADLLVRLRPVMGLVVHVKNRGEPQPDAIVHVAGLSLWPERVVRTTKDGSVDITGLGAGSYSLYAEFESRVSAGLVDVVLEGKRGTREVVLELADGEFVDLHVVDDRGDAIGGAQVTWSADGMGQFARRGMTSVTGALRLGPVATARGLVQAAAPGHIERVVPVEKAGPLTVVLDRAGIVVGRVVDERGFPVAHAEVEVVGTDVHGMPVFVRHAADAVREAHFDWAVDTARRLVPAGELGVMLGPVPPIPLTHSVRSGGAVSAAFATDDQGRFRIVDVPPGQIVVLGRHPDFIDGKSAAVTLTPGGRVETEVVLHSGEPLLGRVLDHRGFPVADARVEVTGRGFTRDVTASSDGSFRLAAAPPAVTLRVTRFERPLRVLLEARVEKRKATDEIELTLPAPREPTRLIVEDERGDPVALAEVRLTSRDDRVPFEETRFTSDAGDVEFQDVSGLDVRLTIRAPGFVDWERWLRLPKERKIELTTAIVAVGRVTAVRGRWPAAGAEIVIESGGTTKHARASDVGEYRVTGLGAGPATLRAQHPEHGRGRLELVLTPGVGGRNVELPDLDLTPGVEVTGRVVDARGFPVPFAWIASGPLSVYLPRASSTPDAIQANDHGEFSFSAPRDARLELFAVKPAVAGGSLVLEPGTRDRIEDVEIRLDQLDIAPADELGTLLFSLEVERGALRIVAVVVDPRRPRDELLPGDVIERIDGETPRDLEDARVLLSGAPGSEVRLEILRHGRPREVRRQREAFLR